MDSHQRRRALLEKERRWLASYTPNPPEWRATDLVPGLHYFVVMRHSERCWINSGWHCTCRPRTRFYAAEAVTDQRYGSDNQK